MFWHNFKYNLKILLHDYALIFWTLAFPLIMATFFNLAFSNIESSEKLEVIDIAVVEPTADADPQQELILQTLEQLSQEGSDEQLFHLTTTSREEAERLLVDEEIVGFVDFEEGKPKVTAHTSGIEVTILNLTLLRILDQATIIGQISTQDPQKLAELAQAEAVNLHDTSPDHLSYTMVEFYTLIAMTCLYGSIISMAAVNHLLANMSASGKRIAVSPTPKLRLLASSLLSSYLVQLVGLSLLFAYTVCVLKVDYGGDLPMIILLAVIGSLCGLALGAMIASVMRTNENNKVGLITAFTMFGCFLAGMMGITMKYLVDTNFPLLNQLNPANLITDGLYALYYYGAAERFWTSIATLSIITAVIIGAAVWGLRKEQYDYL